MPGGFLSSHYGKNKYVLCDDEKAESLLVHTLWYQQSMVTELKTNWQLV